VTLTPGDSGWAFAFDAVCAQDMGLSVGDEVAVELSPEGLSTATWPRKSPLRSSMNPAGGGFDTLAQFYQNACLRWIDATTCQPDLRGLDRRDQGTATPVTGSAVRRRVPPAGVDDGRCR
jgi:hypothetical protein